MDTRFGDIAVGLYDVPSSPEAMVLYLNPLETNAVVFGSSMSGKTTMIKNLLARMNEMEPYRSCENTYILDFGGALSGSGYRSMRRVCACFDNSNEENIKRVFDTVERKLAENARALKGVNYLSYLENKEPGKPPLPHLTLILDNANAFLTEERYSDYKETLIRLARDGLSKGVSVLMTASDGTEIPTKLLSSFQRKFALMINREQCLTVFGRNADIPIQKPGRGLALVDQTIKEFQAYLPFKPEEEAKKVSMLGRQADPSAAGGGVPVPKLEDFPEDLTETEADKLQNKSGMNPDDIPQYGARVGFDYITHKPFFLDFDEMHTIAVYGKRDFGQENLLHLLLKESLKDPDARYVLYSDAEETLNKTRAMLYGKLGERRDRAVTMKSVNELGSLLDQLSRRPVSQNEARTFYIIRSRKIFQPRGSIGGFGFAPFLAGAQTRRQTFIFVDVPPIGDRLVCTEFNMEVQAAFLLDSIGEFLMGKGGSSVFNVLNPGEMKREYAPCSRGDGFAYDTGRDVLSKIRIIQLTEPDER